MPTMPLPPVAVPLFWLGLLIILVVVEGLTAGLVCIWFALGALAALITTFLTQNLFIQALVFVVVSLLSMALIRPMARKVFHTRKEATNADRILNQTAVVTQEIDNLNAQGQVKVLGQIWTARSESPDPIPEGSLVTVLRIEGVRVVVRLAEAPVSAPSQP